MHTEEAPWLEPNTPPPPQGFSCPQRFQVFKSCPHRRSYSISHSELRPFVCGKAFKRPGEVSLHTPAPVGSGSHLPAVFWRFQDAGQQAQHVLDHLAGRNFLDHGETAGAP